jgi:hypothetical protein
VGPRQRQAAHRQDLHLHRSSNSPPSAPATPEHRQGRAQTLTVPRTAGIGGQLTQTGKRIKTADAELNALITAAGSSLLRLHGIGPSGAAGLLGDVADIARFAGKGRFASWNGTAPLDASSGDQVRHRLSRAGNRRINRVLHIMAIVALRNDTEGLACYRRKPAAGKTAMEALRCLKRRLSDVVCQQMHADAKRLATSPGGHAGAPDQSSAADSHPSIGTPDQSLPGPANTELKANLPAAS